MKRELILLILGLTIMSCTDKRKSTSPQNHSINYINEIDEEYDSYYGFIVKNAEQHKFYYLDREIMMKYISNDRIDTSIIKEDILKSKWLSPIIGTSYDYFIWLNFIETKSEIDSLEFRSCKETGRSQIIPVYITQFNRKFNNVKTRINSCNDFFSKIYEQPSLNLVYVIPLNYEDANDFLKIKDTLDRKKYENFLKNIIH